MVDLLFSKPNCANTIVVVWFILTIVGCGPREAKTNPSDNSTPAANQASTSHTISGVVTVAGRDKGILTVGYCGIVVASDRKEGFKVFRNTVDGEFPGDKREFQSDASKPHVARLFVTKGAGFKYDHTNLPAGRYLVVTKLKDMERKDGDWRVDGLADFRWVTVGASEKVDVPLVIDEAKHGSVAVKVPLDWRHSVQLSPDDPDSSSYSNSESAVNMRKDIVPLLLQFSATPAHGEAVISPIAEGKYRVTSLGMTGKVTVVAGKEALVTLQ